MIHTGVNRVLLVLLRARVGAHRALCLRRSEKSSKILAGSASLLPSLPFPSRPVRDMKMRASELQQAPGPAAASASVAAVPTHKVTVHDRQRGVVHEFVVPQVCVSTHVQLRSCSSSMSLPFLRWSDWCHGGEECRTSTFYTPRRRRTSGCPSRAAMVGCIRYPELTAYFKPDISCQSLPSILNFAFCYGTHCVWLLIFGITRKIKKKYFEICLSSILYV